ncbi:uncharacterized protein LOC143027995 [Oratosquilla oratoria]|uniref:uncharacterized protein LOC143027995 n=1 Tax=Oratosquilla oratoria TaxID=337810 RepID=UPI003F773565
MKNKAVQQKQFTLDFRRRLLYEQVEEKKKLIKSLNTELDETLEEFRNCVIASDLRDQIERALQHSLSMYINSTETRVQKKLSRLYGSKVLLPKRTDGYLNISNYILSDIQKEFLNLGLKCNYMPKFRKIEKTAELELLYRNLCELHKDGKINMNPDVKEQLQAESTKHRGVGGGSLLTAELRQAAKELRENKDIVIRRADKSDLFVILNRSDYFDKVDSLLQDSSKFLQIRRNPVDRIRKKVTDLINNANAVIDGVKFHNLQGHYEPGYFYGNVKTHKPGCKLRPIISQIPTPTYQLAKQLNDLITPYIPTLHSLRSTDEFVDILRNTALQGKLASLDVESLFSNLPVRLFGDEVYQRYQGVSDRAGGVSVYMYEWSHDDESTIDSLSFIPCLGSRSSIVTLPFVHLPCNSGLVLLCLLKMNLRPVIVEACGTDFVLK